jgi:ankyrin repeat protein
MNVTDQNSSGLTALYLAVAFNHINLVILLVKHDNRQLTVPNYDGWTPLHKAADTGLPEMTSILLELGCKIDAKDNKGLTPLHLAARRGHLEIVQILGDAGASIHATNKRKSTPLDLATTGGHLETSRWLLNHGANVSCASEGGWTPLHSAARGGYEHVVSLLLEYGAQLMAEDKKCCTPLFTAVRSGSLKTVSTLLNHDLKLRKNQLFHPNRKGETARTVAFYTAHPDIAKYLRGAESEYITPDNVPANQLSLAIEQNDIALITKILNNSPSTINQPDSDGQPPLHIAIQEQNLPIAITLLSAGASISSSGYHGWQPLHIAASLGNLPLVQLCLQHNSNIHSTSASGQTALHKACSSHSVAVVRLLLENGADPHLPNERGMTPLHIAAHQNQLEIARCLVAEYGADVLVVDHMGDTPGEWAGRNGHYEMLEYLREEEERSAKETGEVVTRVEEKKLGRRKGGVRGGR